MSKYKGQMGRCKHCHYWVRDHQSDFNMGFCHRNAPSFDKYGFCAWPRTHEDNYCGDYNEDRLRF